MVMLLLRVSRLVQDLQLHMELNLRLLEWMHEKKCKLRNRLVRGEEEIYAQSLTNQKGKKTSKSH